MDGFANGSGGDGASAKRRRACARGRLLYAIVVDFVRSALLVLVIGVTGLGSSSIASADGVSSLTSSPVTIYGAKWCSACRALQNGLAERKISFETIDVDDNPAAFSRAKAASGTGNAIPLTSVVRNSNT